MLPVSRLPAEYCSTRTTADSRIGRVVLSGGSAQVAGFKDAFAERTGHKVEMMNPLARMLPTSKCEPEYLDGIAASLGVGVGLALRGTGN